MFSEPSYLCSKCVVSGGCYLLKFIDDKLPVEALHPALKSALSKLYGYTSDAGGIRHALADEREPDIEDARFMLVICSAFVSLISAKARKLGPQR